MGGGILYNKKIFADNGLKVPTTWAEFAANNDTLKAAGIAPIGATYKDTWTSQLFVLADYYNVQSPIPDFADQYTNNKIKYATTPAALAGFQHLQEGFDKGWYAEGLRLGHLRRRPEHAGGRGDRAVPDADLRARDDRGQPPRQHRGHRLLRAAR